MEHMVLEITGIKRTDNQSDGNEKNDIPPLIEVLTSKAIVRILNVLSKADNINIAEVSRRTDLSYFTCSVNLKELAKKNILVETIEGKIRLYKFQDGLAKVKMLKNLFETWEVI